MEQENAIMKKSKAFALRIIKMYKYLCGEKREYVMSKQVLRSGTSIGANVREAIRGQTKPDFIAKMSVAQKEAEETCYWLELLYESGYLSRNIFESMYRDNLEINRILASIIITARQNLKRQLKPKTE
ncbi:MAG: four helix bundle protein [Bacteroidales bacterium]|jgi:four helix bundle protein|nr:four helix bundle protein [Bacteroidales bacterium]